MKKYDDTLIKYIDSLKLDYESIDYLFKEADDYYLKIYEEQSDVEASKALIRYIVKKDRTC